MKIASATMRAEIDKSEFSGALVNSTAQQHGMARYEFRDGRPVDFTCLCGLVFADSARLAAHAFNEDGGEA